MSNELNDVQYVDPMTDDLDSFSDLLSGKAEVLPPEENKEKEVETNSEEIEKETVETVSETDSEDADENDDEGTEETPEDKTAETENDDSLDDSKENKPKKPSRFQERINELTAKAREAERALEALKAEQEKKSELKDTPKTAEVVVDSDGPTPEDKNPDGSDKYPLGEFDPAYIRDMVRHTIDKESAEKRKQEEAENEKRQKEEAVNVLNQQWAEKLAPVAEQYDDFLDKTIELESTFEGLDSGYSEYLVQTIKSLDHGPEVLYYFANNLDEAKKFVSLGPLAATLALGEYNAMFKGQSKKEPNKVSKAPPPPQVNKGSKTRTAVSPDTDDLDAFSQIFFKKKA